jgi:HAD superfamily hydrolase (TIGR01509 family)
VLPSAVVFDIDGTLVTFKFDVQGTRKALIEELTRRGYDTSGLGLNTPTQTILDSASSQVTTGRVREDFETLRWRLYQILDEFETESVGSTSVLPGTREALERLKSRSVRLAVLTNSGKKAAMEALKRAALFDCFEFVLTRDETDAMKPRPEGLAKAVSMLGVSPGSAYYVGDSPYDISAARLAGMKVISVATGNYNIDRLQKEGADHVVSSVADIPTLFGI